MVYILDYVYSVIDCSEPKSFGWIGLKGEEVFTISYEGISAVISRIQTDFLLGTVIEPTEANWLKHDEVVKMLMKDYTVLPVKFGSVLKFDRDLKMMLRRILPECRVELIRFKGKIEVGVKILSNQEEIINEASKEKSEINRFRRNLMRVRELMKRGRRISLGEAVERQLDTLRSGVDPELSTAKAYYAESFYNALSRHAVEARANPLYSEDMILNSSFLIHSNGADGFQPRLAELKERYPSFQFLFSGPWAPYNFTKIKYY